jgi:CheY-like chemotaxis protein
VVDVSPEAGKTVLVVDDEEQVRKLTCRILQRAGYVVLSARSGQEALTISRGSGEIHLLLSDVELGGMTGIELGHQVKAERPAIAVLLYSANLAYASTSEFPFLGKPFHPTILVDSVSKALENQTGSLHAVEPAVAEPVPVAGPAAMAQKTRGWLQTASYLAAAAVLILSLTVGLRRVNTPSPNNADTVNLRTWRGHAGSATAKTGRSLVLNLNLTGVPQHNRYRIELVGTDG